MKAPTAKQLLDRVKQAVKKEDYEKAHQLEDELLRAAVRAALSGHPDAAAVCLHAVQSLGLDYPRWYS